MNIQTEADYMIVKDIIYQASRGSHKVGFGIN